MICIDLSFLFVSNTSHDLLSLIVWHFIGVAVLAESMCSMRIPVWCGACNTCYMKAQLGLKPLEYLMVERTH